MSFVGSQSVLGHIPLAGEGATHISDILASYSSLIQALKGVSIRVEHFAVKVLKLLLAQEWILQELSHRV